MTARKDIIVRKNASFKLSLTYTDRLSTPIDLTGASVRMQFRNEQGGDTLYYDTDTDEDVTITELDGIIDIVIPDEITATLDFVRGEYDIVITWADGSKDAIIAGYVTLVPGVTV